MPPHPLADTLRGLAKALMESVDCLDVCDDGGELESMLRGVESTVYRALRDIREAVNSLRPLNCLPPELLARVLSLVPGRRDTELEATKFWPYYLANVSRFDMPISVCRHWRNTALNTPTLWADICILKRQVSNHRDVHQRFPHCPLNLFIERHDSPWGDRAISLLRKHGPRIKLLHIVDIDGGFGSKALDTICSLPAQELQHCALLLNHIPPEEHTKVLFRAGYDANLRSLLLDGLPFLPSNSFPALRLLILCLRNPASWDMADLLTFLSRLPSLERWHIHLGHDILERVAANLPLICLKALRKLTIRSYNLGSDASISIIRTLCTHVSVPNVAHRAVDVCSVNDFPALHSCLTSSRGASYPEITVDSHKLKFRRRDPTQTLSFHFIGRGFQHSGADIIALLSTPPLFSAVQECRFMTVGKISGECFASLPTLPNPRGLVAALQVPYHDQTNHDIVRYLTHTRDAPTPCRRLETLCLWVSGGRMTHIPAQLSAMLLSRREAGCPVRQVILGFFANADGDVDAQLRKMDGLVNELVWFWEVGIDWMWRMPSLLLSSSPIHAEWADTKVGWADTYADWADED